MRKYFPYFIYIILWVLTAPVAFSQPLQLQMSENIVPLGSYLEVFEDKEGDLTFNEVKNKQFHSVFEDGKKKSSLSYGYTKSAYWIRFQLFNKKPGYKWILEQQYANTNYIDLYIVSSEGKQLSTYNTGTYRKLKSRGKLFPRFIFELSPAVNKGTTYYMRFKTNTSMTIDLKLYNNSSFNNVTIKEFWFTGFMYGTLILMICYNLFLLICLKERDYLTYILFILGFLFFYTNYSGIGRTYLWPDRLTYEKVCMPISLGGLFYSLILFSMTFLKIKERVPKEFKALRLLSYLWLSLFIPIVVFSDSLILKPMIYLGVFTVLVLIVISINNAKYRQGGYYLSGFLFFIVGFLTTAFVRAGFINSSVFTENTYTSMFVLMTLCWSLGLADRVNEYKKETEFVNKELRKNRLSLEDLVHKRTDQLLLSEARFEAIVKSSPIGMYMYELNDKNELILMDANPAAKAITGIDQSDYIGKTFEEIFPKTVETSLPRHFKKTASSGVPIKIDNLAYKDHNIDAIFDVYAFQTLPQQMVVAFMDVTQRKRFEEELNSAKEAAERANKAKSEFLANMSHELRTPLNAVIGFSELLTSVIQDKKQKSYLTSIKTAGKSLLTLINDILDLSKIEAGKIDVNYAAVNIYDLFNEIEVIFKENLARKGISYITDIEQGFPVAILLDETRLRQILLNLVGNAVKFTEKGYIKLSAKVAYTSFDIKHQEIVISIEDTGIGIPKENGQTIFKAFKQQSSQSNRKYGGTGLGLSITKRLTEIMNGNITLESEVGKGSTFSINFCDVEVVPCDLLPEEDSLYDIDNIKFEKAKILVVDDIESNRNVMDEILRKVNLDVLTANNGQEAIEVATTSLPDVIFMDIRMPVMDGKEATLKLKSLDATRDIPIVALTASTSPQDKNLLLKRGFDGYLNKPLNVTKMFKALSHYLEFTERVIKEPEIIDVLNDQLLNQGINDLEELVNRMHTEASPIVGRLHGVISLEEVEVLADRLLLFGKDHDVPALIKYADLIHGYKNSFDVEGIESAIVDFPKILNSLNIHLDKSRN